jgi:hypothetical protein
MSFSRRSRSYSIPQNWALPTFPQKTSEGSHECMSARNANSLWHSKPTTEFFWNFARTWPAARFFHGGRDYRESCLDQIQNRTRSVGVVHRRRARNEDPHRERSSGFECHGTPCSRRLLARRNFFCLCPELCPALFRSFGYFCFCSG